MEKLCLGGFGPNRSWNQSELPLPMPMNDWGGTYCGLVSQGVMGVKVPLIDYSMGSIRENPNLNFLLIFRQELLVSRK